MTSHIPGSGFAPLGLSSTSLSQIHRLGYVEPTPIQAAAIPPALNGSDVVGIAQTGTGKTLAFGLPIVERLASRQIRRALILAPTRELALQIDEALEKLGRPTEASTAVLIGGASMGKQIAQLNRRPRVIVATPGRLLDHLDSGRLDLSAVDVLVLDEADRMLDMGFLPAIRRIVGRLPENRQTMLFSATMPKEIEALAAGMLRNPIKVQVQPPGTTVERIDQELMLVGREDKNALLQQVLHESSGAVLVFARTRHGARKVAKSVRAMGHAAAEIHSDRTLAQRREALDGFKRGQYRVLVATDIAARGIDVKDIGLVVNYDLPDNPEDYVHRIGRTGRAGASGKAVTFALPEQAKDVRNIEKLTRVEIRRAAGTPPEFAKPSVAPTGKQRPFVGGSRPASRGKRFGGPGQHGPRHARAR